MTDLTDEAVKALLDGATPGPWAMETVRTSCGTCHRIGPFPRPAYASKPEGWACVYDDYPPGVGSPDLLANSRLIAVAPDLARALLDARAELDTTQTQLGDWIVRADEANVKVETLEAELARVRADAAAAMAAQVNANQRRADAATLLLDMLYMRNRAHQGLSRDAVEKIWKVTHDEDGFQAVVRFLSTIAAAQEGRE